MRKNKILGRVAAYVAAGVLVLSSCTACGVNIYSTMDDKIDLVIEGGEEHCANFIHCRITGGIIDFKR